jgi:hypothetical protein
MLLIGNKIEDQEDTDYLISEWIHIDFSIPYKKNLKIYKRNKKILEDTDLDKIFSEIYMYVEKNITVDRDKRLEWLHILHRKYIELDYIKSPLGDLSHQIDQNFHF